MTPPVRGGGTRRIAVEARTPFARILRAIVGDGGVAVCWTIVPPAAASRLLPTLPAQDRERIRRRLRARDRDALAASASLARAVLRVVTGSKPSLSRRCSVCGDPAHGRPVLEGGSIEFSVSRAAPFVAVALSPVPVGVDVELRARTMDVAAIALACDEAERALLPSLPVDDLRRLWTAKEALGKAIGVGLVGIERYRVWNDAAGSWRSVVTQPGRVWSVRALDVGPAACAVAVAGNPRPLQALRVDLEEVLLLAEEEGELP